jgi:hypothetical protein
MAQWIRRLPTEQEILGSSPSADERHNPRGQESAWPGVRVVRSPCGLVVMTPVLHAGNPRFNPWHGHHKHLMYQMARCSFLAVGGG